MPTKAEDEGGLTPVEDDNVGGREIYRKYATISRPSDYIQHQKFFCRIFLCGKRIFLFINDKLYMAGIIVHNAYIHQIMHIHCKNT